MGVLKKIVEIYNSNIIKNADALLNRMEQNGIETEWLGKNRTLIPENKFKVSY